MKLLFDQNVSPKLVALLADLFPGSAHADPLGLATADDDVLWNYASTNGFTIISKDEDFNLLSVARGAPPKVIWLQLGNCTTAVVETALRSE
jgi:predicted nuclease of predicted toxin-antitoxin system